MSSRFISVTHSVQNTVLHDWICDTTAKNCNLRWKEHCHFTADCVSSLNCWSWYESLWIDSSFEQIWASMPALELITANEWSCRQVTYSLFFPHSRLMFDASCSEWDFKARPSTRNASWCNFIHFSLSVSCSFIGALVYFYYSTCTNLL